MKIVLKILAPYLQDRAKTFLDDMEVQGPKTTYNNKELAPRIRQYIVKHIQNLDQLLANLEGMEVTISRAKSQFCQADIKIIRYICDTDGRHLDISKILVILE